MKKVNNNQAKGETMRINYWTLLQDLGIVYGRDVVLGHEISGAGFIRVLEYNGKNYRTAREIFEEINK